MQLAQTTSFSIGDVVGDTLPSVAASDNGDYALNIMQWILLLLAVTLVLVVLVSGIRVLISKYRKDPVVKGKKLLKVSSLVLVGVLLAWAVVIFVAGTTVSVTQ